MKRQSVLWLVVCVASLAACGGGPGGGGEQVDARGSGGGGGDDDASIGVDASTCGNGAIDPGEACDDGNPVGGDGCPADCAAIEPGWLCGEPGILCVRAQVCGDGHIETGESCDDRNLVSGDGCDAACQLEAGWTCEVPGIRCTAARCGDDMIAGFEECDDGDTAGGDGCSSSCTLEPGHACDTPGAPCRTTVCGDGVAEGTEQCDDGDHDLGDGCDPLCQREPRCSNGVCEAVCGDGVLQTGEACDDGNFRNADGCSSTCVVETGFTCSPVTDAEPGTLGVAIVYRDFRGFDLTNGHPDFEHGDKTGDDRGIVTDTLGPDGKPVYASGTTTKTTFGAAAFQSWYRDTPGVNMSYADTLTLTRTGLRTYVFDSGSFFPLDSRGFVAAGTEPLRTSNNHNFHFTSELRYWFDYKGGEVLSFRGDDDVWVFINGKRAIDLGGVHSAENASITLNSTAATSLNLTIGGTYEVVVFQAERHTTQSSYKLTLQGFNAAYSVCDDACGDGVTSANEVCDDGVNQNGYNSCAPGCLGFGPRCGDGLVQDTEQCDDGVNSGAYGTCAPTCTLGPRCGDGIVQSAREDCDDGNSDPADGCDACVLVIQ